jgi:hypothetical protein
MEKYWISNGKEKVLNDKPSNVPQAASVNTLLCDGTALNDKVKTAIKTLQEVFVIPVYAYGDNEAACTMIGIVEEALKILSE